MHFKSCFLFRFGLICLLAVISIHCFAQMSSDRDDFVENNLRDVAIRLRIKKSKACIPVYSSADLTTQVQCLTQNAVISTLIPRDIEISPGTSDRKSIQKMLERHSSDSGSLQKVIVESGRGSEGKLVPPGLPGYIDLKAANKAGAIGKYIGEDVGAYPDYNDVRDSSGPVHVGTKGRTCPNTFSEELGKTSNAICGSVFECYSKDPQVQKMIRYARSHLSSKQKRLNHPMCFRAVKLAMETSKMARPYMDGVYPKYSDEDFKKAGFKNALDNPEMKAIIRSPNDAFKGAILIYDSIPHDRADTVWNRAKHKYVIDDDAGHSEIKTSPPGQGGYVSDYSSEQARTGDSLSVDDPSTKGKKGTHRKLIGVYYRDDIEKACENKAASSKATIENSKENSKK